jgi:hypothetical protein
MNNHVFFHISFLDKPLGTLGTLVGHLSRVETYMVYEVASLREDFSAILSRTFEKLLETL